MNKRFEYATTQADLTDWNGYTLDDTPDPSPPIRLSEGWELKAAIEHSNRVLWFWQREITVAKKPRRTKV